MGSLTPGSKIERKSDFFEKCIPGNFNCMGTQDGKIKEIVRFRGHNHSVLKEHKNVISAATNNLRLTSN